MTAEAWGFATAFGVALVANAAVVWVAYLKLKADTIAARSAASEARTAATQAKDNTANVSNGFASNVMRSLDALQSAVADMALTHGTRLLRVEQRLERHIAECEALRPGDPS